LNTCLLGLWPRLACMAEHVMGSTSTCPALCPIEGRTWLADDKIPRPCLTFVEHRWGKQWIWEWTRVKNEPQEVCDGTR